MSMIVIGGITQCGSVTMPAPPRFPAMVTSSVVGHSLLKSGIIDHVPSRALLCPF